VSFVRTRKPDVELRTNHNDRNESQIVFAWDDSDRDIAFMRQEINASIGITPIDGIHLDLENMTDCRTFRHDWNVKELVWRSDTAYWYMRWETAA
jgi:hypothetical protein